MSNIKDYGGSWGTIPIYGSYHELLAALEWVLDPNGDGDISDRLDIALIDSWTVLRAKGCWYYGEDDPSNLTQSIGYCGLLLRAVKVAAAHGVLFVSDTGFDVVGQAPAAGQRLDQRTRDEPYRTRARGADDLGSGLEGRGSDAPGMGTALGAELDATSARIEDLERAVKRPWRWDFADEDDRWWHNQLEKLVVAIEAFADSENGLIEGVSVEQGWGIERRRAFGAQVKGRTVSLRRLQGLPCTSHD